MDSGIRETHEEFRGAGKVVKETASGYTPTDEQKFHGTFVTALAVGNRGNVAVGRNPNMHGVAYDAGVYFLEVPLGSPGPPGDYMPTTLVLSDDQDGMELFTPIIIRARGRIINFSFGRSGAISSYTRAEIRRILPRTAAALAQTATAAADKKIIVWAAGNAGRTTERFDAPEFLAGLGVYFPELRPHVLAVVALDQDGSIADYSNRCGIAKSFCLAAPGSFLLSASFEDDAQYFPQSGTSFAAPLVSGSLALLRQYFRGQLGSTELVARLLATADKTGIYANSDTYGAGLVDLDAATRPSGVVSSGFAGDPGSRPLAGSRITLHGGAFGSALETGLAGVEMVGFDELNAPFPHSAGAWVSRPEARDESRSVMDLPASGARLSLALEPDGAVAGGMLGLADGWWLSYGEHGGRMLGAADEAVLGSAGWAPYLSLVRDGPGLGHARAGGSGVSFALMHGSPQFDGYRKPGGRDGLGVAVDYRLRRSGLSLQAGAVREGDGFLGTRTAGALGEASAATAFVGLTGKWRLGRDWRLSAAGYLGNTRPQIDHGLLQDAGNLMSSAFSIGAGKASHWRLGDWLGVQLRQPLRVESGRAKLKAAAGRTRYGEIVMAEHDIALAPSGRNVAAAAIYRMPLAGGLLHSRIGIERHPGHDRRRGTAPFFGLAFEKRF